MPAIKNLLFIVLGLLAGMATVLLYQSQYHIKKNADSAGLEEAYQALSLAVSDAGTFVQNHQWYGSEREQAEAYRHIVRALISSLELKALSDTDFPFFHEMTTSSKTGMDNSDQRYLITMIHGEGTYRVWGNRGSTRRLNFTLYPDGSPMAPSFATLTSDDLIVNDDGSFELFIGGEKQGVNWLPLKRERFRLLIRQIHADWDHEMAGNIHIDRIDEGRPLYPTLSKDRMTANLDHATHDFTTNVQLWPELSRTRFALLMPPNALTPPQDTGIEGGLTGRWMVGGHFNLADDEALIISTRKTEAKYQSIQLGHHWWESLDYANRQTSLTVDQSYVDTAGNIHYVISQADPQIQNWLDTEGFTRGVVLMRFDGLDRPLSESERPTSRLIKLNALENILPNSNFTKSQREEEILSRRRHIQKRYNY
jgi:hypothetical protein